MKGESLKIHKPSSIFSVWGFNSYLPERSGTLPENPIQVDSRLVTPWGVWQTPALMTVELSAFDPFTQDSRR